jgi:hypothetical protein
MMRVAVAPDLARCRLVAGFLRTLPLPKRLVRQDLFCCDRRSVGNFNALLVAICHQTQNVAGEVDGRWRRGWDYLETRLDRHCRDVPRFLELERWRTLSSEELSGALAPFPTKQPIADSDTRAELIRDLGGTMLDAGYSSLEELCGDMEGRCRGGRSIISFLKNTKAYSDPNEKKARLLIGLLRDAHGWEFKDAHELGAPVDYHEIRGHLRVGTVIIADSDLNARIGIGNITSDEDNLVRAAIGDAISAIAADLPNHDPLQVHYILWNFFRAICRREVPACRPGGTISMNELDPAYMESFAVLNIDNPCGLSSFCQSFRTGLFPIEYQYAGSYY